MVKALPDISNADFTNGEELLGFGILLTSLLKDNGIISYDRLHSKDSEEIKSLVLNLVRAVENNIASVKKAYVLPVLDIYNMMSRFVLQQYPDSFLISKCSMSAVDSYVKGDDSIDGFHVMLLLANGTNISDAKGYEGLYKDFYTVTLKNWLDEFAETGNFLSVSIEEAITRATVLIKVGLEELTKDAESVRKTVVERISLLFQHIPTFDSDVLKKLLIFLRCIRNFYIDENTADRHTKTILERLSMLPDVNRYERQSYRLEYEDMCRSGAKYGN